MVDEDEGDPLERAWARVEREWDDPAAHEAFLQLSLQLGRLPEAGRRYREVRDGDPGRSEEARRRIDRLLGLATQLMETQQTPPPDTKRIRRWLTLVTGVCCLILMGVALWVFTGE